ncbi:MAG: hypothetical protein FWD41_02895 [Actinomycetia bacterium]|nr:hypothetical protein [Actinomycetes bacterium]
MFSHHLPDDELYFVHIERYAQHHFIKRFAKDYPGRQWEVTLASIIEDLRRVRALGDTAQVDELRNDGTCWLFKYNFAIALSKRSPKGSGNRCLVFLDSETHQLHVLVVYRKDDLPRNQSETSYLNSVFAQEFSQFAQRFEKNETVPLSHGSM